MDRLRCSAFLATSLDGFIAREDGRVDWLGPFEKEEHGYQAFFDLFHGEEFLAGSPVDVAASLARTGARRAYVDGGAVVSSFLAAGLLDDLTISIVPVLLGSGIRLFQGGLGEIPLHLESVRPFPSGLVQARYRTRPA